MKADPYLIMPDNDYKLNWDSLITAVLLFSCLATPVQIALFDEINTSWKVINYVVDGLFLIDIITIFNSAAYDEDFTLIDDRSFLIKQYITGWFSIDLIAIIPFELMFNGGSSANLVRLTRIGRITKLLKLMKLMRLMKLQKSSSFSLLSFMQEVLAINPEFRWFFMFFCYFAMTTHIVACVWIIMANFDPETEDSWINSQDFTSKSDLYLTSFYFTITTITTVGYGDISGVTFLEKIINIMMMVAGVIAFSLASGTLTNYI